MSNLSELLPTGGGQNAVEFTASGTLASGQAVSLNSNGSVAASFNNSQTESLGGQTVLSSSNIDDPSIAYGNSADKFVSFFTVGSSVKASVITRSGTSLSSGAEVTVSSGGSFGTVRCDSNSGNFVFSYRNSNSYPEVRIGSISGTSLTFGTAVVVASEDSGSNATVAMGASGKGAVVYGYDFSTAKGVAITVSGTTVTLGNSTTFDTQSSGSVRDFIGSPDYDSGTGRVVFAYQPYDGSTYKISVVSADITGATPSFSSSTTVFSASSNPSNPNIIYDSDQNKFIVGYVPNGDSPFLKTATLSGSSITIAGSYDVDTADVANAGAVLGMAYDSTSKTTALFWYRNTITPTIMYGLVSLSGTTFTKISTSTLSSSSSSWGTDQFFAASDNSGFAVFNYKYSSKSYGQALRIPFTDTNLASFIGITASAIANTATGSVNTFGGINEAQSGLTIGSDYYVQSNGTLSTASASPAIKVGKAISATTINMMDLT